MPYTQNKGFSVQAAGSNSGTWGTDSTTPTANSSNALNEGGFELLDQALGGTTTLSLASTTPIALTQLQTQNGMLRMTGVLLANIVISPDTGVLMTGFYCWENVTTGSFSVTLTNAAGSVALPQGRRGLLWVDTTNGPRVIATAGASTADPVPAGSVVPFYNTSAPAGYTIVALDDYALKVVSSNGANTSGSVNYSTLFARTATDSTALTTSQIPSHQHGQSDGTLYNNTPNTSSGTLTPGGNTFYLDTARQTEATGGGDGHTHPLDMRVKTASVLLASRD